MSSDHELVDQLQPVCATSSAGSRMLLIHGGALGDFVLAVLMIDVIIRECGPFEVHAVCRNRLACLFCRQKILAGWKSLESPLFLPLFGDGFDREWIRSYFSSFDIVISMLGAGTKPVARWIDELTTGRAYHIDPALRAQTDAGKTHILSQWLNDLGWQSMHFDPAVTAVGFNLVNCRSSTPPRTVIIHPGSGSPAKSWPLDNFVTLAGELGSAGKSVEFMVGPQDIEMIGNGLIKRLETVAPLYCEPDVCVAAQRLLSAFCFVGNDSGMTHLAAALGLPTMAIFTATNPDVWRPLGRQACARANPDVDSLLSWITTVER